MTSPLPIDEIYALHGHIVLRRARQILGDEHEARDVLHDIFVSLLRQPEQFAHRASITTFLYAATTHACLNRLRNARTRGALTERELGGRTSAAGPVAEQRHLARSLLAMLPERLAAVAVYHFIDEMTHEEIAGIIDLSRRQVGNLVERARKELSEWALSA
jgi:RNA polymerase sigma-70 factor (ECF subfamily)